MTGTAEADANAAEEVVESSEGGLPEFVPTVATYVMALVAIAVGVLVGPAFVGTSMQSANPGSAHSLVPLAVGITIATVSILAVMRLGYGEQLLRVLFVGIFAGLPAQAVLVLAGPLPAAAVGVVLFAAIWLHPEWYVLDLAGILYVGVANGVLGVSLVPALIIVALAAMAAYDAYSVYVSEHMQSLVEGGTVMDIPMAFIVPRRAGFSLRDADGLEDMRGEAALLGFGDAFFPGILAVSAGHFLAAPTLVAGIPFLNAPAIGALVGGVVGMVGLHILMKRVERAHPALIVLNPAVVAGYLLGAVAAGVPLATAVGL